MEKLYTVSKTRLGAGCGSNHELLIAKLRLKLKKIGNTSRSFRYDLNKILYYFRVGVTNRFKGLYLVDREHEELWMEVCNVAEKEGSGYIYPQGVGGNARKQSGYLRRLLQRRRRAERSYSTFKVRKGSREKILLVQGKEQWLRFAGAAVKTYPMSKVRETQVRWEVL